MVEARKALQAAVEQARQFDRLLASGKVTVNVQQTEGGVTVTISSSDPKLAAEIKDKLQRPASHRACGARAVDATAAA